MKDGVRERYSADAFALWQEERLITRPYFDEVHATMHAMLGGASSILDLAGGRGHPYEMLTPELQSRTTTVDFDGDALEDFRRGHNQARLAQGDIRQLPFADGTFEAAISVSSFDSFSDSSGMVEEIERVLAPGGQFIFFRDTPYHLRQFALGVLKGHGSVGPANVIAMPIVNDRSGDIDQFLRMPIAAFQLLDEELRGPGRLMFDAVKQYLDTNWLQSIYGMESETGTIAAKLTRFIPTIRQFLANIGQSFDGLLTEPLEPLLEQIHRERFSSTGLSLIRHEVAVDYVIDDPLVAADKPLDELYVDRLSNMRTKPKTKSSKTHGTRVYGFTPIYVATK